jgi:hypothetical protein
VAWPPEQYRPVIRLLLVALAIGVVVVALIAALVWRPLVSSLYLGPAPALARAGHGLAAETTPVSASAARAP